MRVSPDFIEACVHANPESQIPERFRRWAAISAVSAALGRRVWYDAGEFTIYPNQFIVLVAEPGRGKSVSLNLPYNKVLYSLSLAPGEKLEDSPNKKRIEEHDLTSSPIYLLEDRITPEEITVQMARAQFNDPDLSTLEGTHTYSAVTLLTSEFGTLMARDGRYLPLFLTDIWDGKRVQSDRTKTSGRYVVRNPCLNWIACATPQQFVENMPKNARSQGLLSRMLIIHFDGPRLKEDIHYGGATPQKIEELQHDMACIAKLRGPVLFDNSIVDKVRSNVSSGLHPRPSDPNLAEFLERRVSHLLKLAICVTAARRNTLIVTAQDWETAKQILFDAETEMPAALTKFGMGSAGLLARDMQEYLLGVLHSSAKCAISITSFRREILRRVNNPSEVEQTLRAMTDSGLIKLDGALVKPGDHT